jgi:SLOG family protein/SIR2-like protein
MSTISRKTFLDSYLNAMISKRAAVFGGAGLSVPAGFVDWKALLRPLAEDIGLDINREHDLLRVVQYSINQAGGRARVNNQLIEEFDRRLRPTPNHELLAQLPINFFWTTNYDSLIEDSLRDAGRMVAVNHSQEQLTSQSNSAEVVVYKIHGDKSRPDQCILSQDDYERFADTRGEFIGILQSSLVEKTFLFLGYSLADPNVDHILARLRVRFGPDRREHFWITKRPLPDEFEDEGQYWYARGRDDLRMRDLQRYGIQTLSIDSYDEITELLEELIKLYRRRFVFVSGAAHDFAPLGQSELESLVRSIGERLAAEEYTLISGGGLGIGTAAVLGAVAYASRQGTTVNERVRVTAFDQDIDSRELVYQEYREQMLKDSGFAIFVSGNRLEGTDVRDATGVQNEFETAIRKGVIPIPVGATGYVASKLWRVVRDQPHEYFDGDHVQQVAAALDKIGPGVTDRATMLRGIFDIIHLYDGRRH